MPILSWDQCLFSLHKHHQVKVACLSLLLVDWHHWHHCLTYMVDAMSVAVLLQYYTSCMLHLEMTWTPLKILCDFEYFCDTVAWTASLISPHLALSQPCSSSAWRFPPYKKHQRGAQVEMYWQVLTTWKGSSMECTSARASATITNYCTSLVLWMIWPHGSWRSRWPSQNSEKPWMSSQERIEVKTWEMPKQISRGRLGLLPLFLPISPLFEPILCHLMSVLLLPRLTIFGEKVPYCPV